MREIKFRAWDKDTGVMFEPDAIHKDGRPLLKGPEKGKATGYDCPVMQFTGLKDKNGKEIYEGDILKMNGGAEDFYGSVGFEMGCFVFLASWIKEGKAYPELKYYTEVLSEIEIIGNIYETPELLKATA